MLNGALSRALRAFGNAMLLMAIADDEYWLARGQLVDPELARLLPRLGVGIDTDEPNSRLARDDAIHEAEWLLSEAREDEAVPA